MNNHLFLFIGILLAIGIIEINSRRADGNAPIVTMTCESFSGKKMRINVTREDAKLPHFRHSVLQVMFSKQHSKSPMEGYDTTQVRPAFYNHTAVVPQSQLPDLWMCRERRGKTVYLNTDIESEEDSFKYYIKKKDEWPLYIQQANQ